MTIATIQLQNNTLVLSGNWDIRHLGKLAKHPLAHLIFPTYSLKIDGQQINKLDAPGAILIQEIRNELMAKNIIIEKVSFKKEHEDFIKQIKAKTLALKDLPKPPDMSVLERIGKNGHDHFLLMLSWLAFIGELAVIFIKSLKHPQNFRWKYCLNIVENAGYRGLPIIGFLSALIGLVLTYEIGVELQSYGANIYIVRILGIAILREFGVLIAAILVVGRTGAAFTAQLGAMKVNEEIDAIETMGLSSLELLVIPRLLAMLIVMPLMTVLSDFFGMFGGMLMAKATLGIGYATFVQQISEHVSLTSFLIGMAKAPIFGAIIASVGCFQAYRVTGSASSIGWQTTKSVVLALFMIIIADAFISLILSWLKI
jgi:phospholipid/cholesterol/gamma-HCH transport system permease protein